MNNKDQTHDRRSSVQAVDVAARVLQAMCDLRRPAQLKEISEIAGLQTAKAHRYLTSLVASGLASQQSASGLYRLGPMALRLGVATISANDLVNRASEALRELCIEYQTSGHLSIWGERGPVIIRNEHGGPPIISTMGLGAILPLLRSATGRTYLAYLPRATTEAILSQELESHDLDAAEIETLCIQIRERGYADIQGGLVPGLFAVTFPVFGIDGSLQCTLTFISTDQGFFEPDQGNLQNLLNAANKVSDPILGPATAR